ncbi:outer membrane beta-barrel protein [Algoriphagus litoralis]|uniref:outer membrane beta-barrel protein n=1 Tax=Algoriphagus litoralis TaxID=2202829 RepID=UPI000DBAB04B|nr:outer membrane beta-barrel protein [Algoriphagus litoralis]
MNRTLLLIFPLLLLSFSGFAQLQKGNKIFGGTLNYSTTNSDINDTQGVFSQTSESNNFYIGPVLGVFFSDRTVVGLAFNFYSFNNETTFQNGELYNNKSNQFGFGPFVRRYFPVKEWVAFYGQAELGYSSGKIKQTYSSFPDQNYERSTSVFNFRGTLGLAFFPTNWMSVDLSMNPLSFSHSVNKNEVGSSYPDQNSNSFNFNLSSESFGIGAHFFLNKK